MACIDITFIVTVHVVMVFIVRASYSYRIDNYGLRRYDLYGYGLCNDGLYSYSLYSYGPI